ncbi:MAG: hypothetical protein JJ896_05625 [Rhodothermales bacterium]|nr:hypothetical protein [Rhodothermales bacterium]MBO6779115.1 hypothetical protein [Rhodothermales bacterium]
MPDSKKLTCLEVARLLAGNAEEAERKALLARLALDPEARELLRMALEALEAAEAEDDRQAA